MPQHKWINRIFAGLSALLVLYLGASWILLNRLLIPEPAHEARGPARLGFPEARSVSFRTDGDRIRLEGWLIPSTRARAVVLIHGLHSTAWDCGTPDLVRAYQQAGFHVLVFDLRAHGRSQGERVGAGLRERRDGRAAVDYLNSRVGLEPESIGLHGTSYGAAVALLAAAELDGLGAVLADSAYATLLGLIGDELARRTPLPGGIGAALTPGIRFLARFIHGLDLTAASPVNAIRRIAPTPVLLVHGGADEVIPIRHAERLLEQGGPNTRLWILEGYGHTQGVRLVPRCDIASPMRAEFLQRAIAFFERHLG
jgi:dipeptidyl aminopeptidase/acylaminoacyl peptidase